MQSPQLLTDNQTGLVIIPDYVWPSSNVRQAYLLTIQILGFVQLQKPDRKSMLMRGHPTCNDSDGLQIRVVSPSRLCNQIFTISFNRHSCFEFPNISLTRSDQPQIQFFQVLASFTTNFTTLQKILFLPNRSNN